MWHRTLPRLELLSRGIQQGLELGEGAELFPGHLCMAAGMAGKSQSPGVAEAAKNGRDHQIQAVPDAHLVPSPEL